MPSNDLSLGVDSSSVIAEYSKLIKAWDKVVDGQVGGVDEMNAAMESWSKNVTRVSDKAKRAFENSQASIVKSWEQRAAQASMTGAQKIQSQGEAQIRMLKLQGEAADKVRKSMQQLIKVENERNKNEHGFSSNPMLAIRGVKDLFEGRTAYGEVMLGRAAMGFSATAPLLTGIATGIGLIGVAAVKSYTDLAKLGVEVSATSVRLGVTTKQVGALTYAAEAAGQDVSIFERMMRGLTQATEDQSSAGDKARGWLTRFGVDIRGVRDGTVPMYTLFKQLAEGISSIQNPIERSKAELDILKRVGIESAPVLMEMVRTLKTAEDAGFGRSSEDIANFKRYNENWVYLKTAISETRVELEKHLAVLIDWTAEFVKQQDEIDKRTGGQPGYSSRFRSRVTQSTAPTLDLSLTGYNRGLSPNYSILSANAAARAEYESSLGLEGRLKRAEADLAKTPYDPNLANVEEVAARKAAEARVKSAQDAIKNRGYREAAVESLRKLEIDATERIKFPYGIHIPADRQILEQTKLPGYRGISSTSPLWAERRQQVLDMQARATAIAREGTDRAAVSTGFTGEAKSAEQLSQEIRDRQSAEDRIYMNNRQREERLRSETQKIAISTLSEQRRSEESSALSSVRLSSTLATDTPENRLAAERSIAEAKIRFIDDEYRQKRIIAEADVEFRENLEGNLRKLQLEHIHEIAGVQAELDQARAVEIRHQLDSIKSEATNLFETLFSNPSKFGAQLASTLRSALIRPLASGLGDMTARALQPSVGGIGQALRGLFGGGTASFPSFPSAGYSPSGISTSGMNTDIGGGYGGGVGSTSGTGPTPFLPGLMSGGFLNNGYIGFQGMGETPNFGSLGAPGGTSGTFGAYRLPGMGGSSGGGEIGGIGGALSGLRSIFSSSTLHGLSGNIGNYKLGGMNTGSLSQLATGPFAGTAAGGLAAGAGLGLAAFGLTNPNFAGTWGGVAMGAAGGFLTAGPIGAAVGALIGIGEKIAGVESPRNEAKRLIQSQYHVSINNPMADQIAQIAKQSYGGRISIAVRSPEVRQMLGLYSAGTGQALGLSASTPHGAGLTEAGGRLFSNPTYQYGNVYSAQSAFPTYGGGGGGNNGGGSTYISMNIDRTAVADFLTGQYITPSFVQSQAAAAMRGSQGRQQMMMDMQQPGSIIS